MAVKKIVDIAEALRKNGGFITGAAKDLGITHQAVSLRIKKSAVLQRVREETENIHLDIAESKLLKAIQAGEAWAICFFLKCKGKNRGYVESVIHKTDKDDPIVIKVTLDGPVD